MVKTINPATGEVLEEYDVMTKSQVSEILQKTHDNFLKWKDLTLKERGEYFTKLANVLRENKQEYAEMMTKEMGKPITESLGEVEKCAWLAEILRDNAEEWLKEEKVEADGKKHLIVFEPLGTVFIIMPWNFPFWQAFKVALPPIMAGNAVVMKHASNVTGCALFIEDAFKKAGMNIFRTIIVGHDMTEDIIRSENVQATSLTGSVGVGSKIAELSGKHIKKTVLELGGSDPFIVLDDADIEKAAAGAVLGRTFNGGQVCIGAKRMIVMKEVADEFTSKFAELMSQLKIGDPMDPETKVGPLVNEKAVVQMEAFVKDAVAKGGKLLAGGKRLPGKGFFFKPAVISETKDDMNAICQETFGPVAPVIVVDNEEEAIKVANNTEFGLSGSVWTKDLKRGEEIARKINAGGIFINSISKSHAKVPLGGIKNSGYGRELSHYGIKEFVNVKSINIY